MKFLLHILLIGVFAYLTALIFPWWTLIACAFLVAAIIPTSGYKAFLSGFLAGGLLWLISALYYSQQNEYLITEMMGELILNIGTAGIIGLTFLIGAIAGGLGALCGNQVRGIFRRPGSKRKYSPYTP